MKLSLKFSWQLAIHIINALLVIALLICFWINYSWIDEVQQSIEAKTPELQTIVDTGLYGQVLEKIDAKQKIPAPKTEEIKNIMLPAPTISANTNTVK